MSSEQICEIIRQCGASGATHFKISKDAIEIKFAETKTPRTEIVVDPKSVPQATLITNQGADQPQVHTRDPKEIDAEDELEELAITDPLAYEERIARGELVDANRTGDGTDTEE